MSIVFLLFFLKNCNYFNFIFLFLCPAPLLRLSSGFFPPPVIVLGLPSVLLRLCPSGVRCPGLASSACCPPLLRLSCSACPDGLPAAPAAALWGPTRRGHGTARPRPNNPTPERKNKKVIYRVRKPRKTKKASLKVHEAVKANFLTLHM